MVIGQNQLEQAQNQVEKQIRIQTIQQNALKRQIKDHYRQIPAKKKQKPSSIVQPKSTHSFLIEHIQINGANQMTNIDRHFLTMDYQGKRIGKSQIFLLIQSIRKWYFDRGFVTTQVQLPNQNLSKGILTIHVIEGRVSELLLNHKNNTWNRFRLWQILTVQEGQVFNQHATQISLAQKPKSC